MWGRNVGRESNWVWWKVRVWKANGVVCKGACMCAHKLKKQTKKTTYASISEISDIHGTPQSFRNSGSARPWDRQQVGSINPLTWKKGSVRIEAWMSWEKTGSSAYRSGRGVRKPSLYVRVSVLVLVHVMRVRVCVQCVCSYLWDRFVCACVSAHACNCVKMGLCTYPRKCTSHQW